MIHVNQTGYLPEMRKLIPVSEPGRYRICQADGICCKEIDAKDAGIDEAAGERVYLLDLTSIQQPGVYRIEDPQANSKEITIAPDVLNQLHWDLMKMFYYQRCGCGLKEEHAGCFAHDVCHNRPAKLWENPEITLDVTGGWHDAGDFGRYVTAAATAIGHLLYAYRLFPECFEESLEIPESGNDLPDILNECRCELEWMLKMQRADGGVYHKVTTLRHADFVMPQEDQDDLFVFPVSSMAVGDFCAVTALASKIYRKYDAAFANRLQTASEKSWEWLKENPEFLGFRNPEGCNTGEYDDTTDLDERLWAAAEMTRMTQGKKGMKELKELYEACPTKTELGWADVSGFAGLCVLTDWKGYTGVEMAEKFRHDFVKRAKSLAAQSQKSGYGVSLKPEEFGWGSNMNVLNNGIVLVMAYLFTGDKAFEEAAFCQLDYILGCNPLDMSYVTGHGSGAFRNPHNRPTVADGIDDPISGFVSGGPNGKPCDPDALRLIPEGTAPMKCFADAWECYSLNEITIYWNSPMVFLTAYATRKFYREEVENG